jgi:hypothetical protein
MLLGDCFVVICKIILYTISAELQVRVIIFKVYFAKPYQLSLLRFEAENLCSIKNLLLIILYWIAHLSMRNEIR